MSRLLKVSILFALDSKNVLITRKYFTFLGRLTKCRNLVTAMSIFNFVLSKINLKYGKKYLWRKIPLKHAYKLASA